MRKNDIIKKLQEIKGNPEILLWNGMVCDWMQISSIKESYLTKITKEFWVRSIENERIVDSKDITYRLPQEEVDRAEKRWKKFEWEDNPYVTKEDVKEGRYKTKTVFYIDAKLRGVNTSDRLGGISY